MHHYIASDFVLVSRDHFLANTATTVVLYIDCYKVPFLNPFLLQFCYW